jgi:hypothetical protein
MHMSAGHKIPAPSLLCIINTHCRIVLTAAFDFTQLEGSHLYQFCVHVFV